MSLIAAIAALIVGCFAYIFWPGTEPVCAGRQDEGGLSARAQGGDLREPARPHFEFQAGKYPSRLQPAAAPLEDEAAQAISEMEALMGARHEEHPRQGVRVCANHILLAEITAMKKLLPTKRVPAKDEPAPSRRAMPSCGPMKR